MRMQGYVQVYVYQDKLYIMANYTAQMAAADKKFLASIKKAGTRKAVLDLYWKHKKEHELLLAKHLKEEFVAVNKIKSKIKPL